MKIMKWWSKHNMKHNKLLISTLLVVVILAVILFIITPSPTKTTVDNFLKENSCNPSSLETDYNREYECAAYLRRHTTLSKSGQIINVPKFTFLFVYTPFHYFNYDDHVYIFVVTRDEGPLVYNPVNGNFIGSYNDLTQELGCEVQPYEKPFFPIRSQQNKLVMEHARCTLNIATQRLESQKLSQV